jgi:hypothetical protein
VRWLTQRRWLNECKKGEEKEALWVDWPVHRRRAEEWEKRRRRSHSGGLADISVKWKAEVGVELGMG